MEHDTARLWSELRKRLHGFIARRVGNAADVEDLLQEVCLRMHQHRASVKDPGRLVPWSLQITRHAITDYYRTASRRYEIPDGFVLDREPSAQELPLAPRLHGDEATTLTRELAACLTPMIEQLPQPYREAVLLVEMENIPQRELSTHFGLSLSGVKSRVQRGREQLKKLLLRCCRVEWDTRGNIMHYQPETGCGGCGPPGPTTPSRCEGGGPMTRP